MICVLLAVLTIVLLALNLAVGSVSIPLNEVVSILFSTHPSPSTSHQYIIMESRLPQALTAALCGGSLAVSGLMLQTAFKNPLAGPSIFGINSGAGVGVALVMLGMGGSLSIGSVSVTGFMAVLAAAFVGAMTVMGLIFLFSTMVRNNVMLLIIGIMIGYIANSVVSLLNFFATDEGVKSYMVWGMGSFGGVPMRQMPLFASLCVTGLVGSLLLVKPLNALLLGEQYAENLGVNTQRVRNYLLIVTGLLTAVTTAFCGPIMFIGLAVPHIARLLFPRHHSLWCRHCPVVQCALLPAWRIGCHTPQCRHSRHGSSRHHLRHCTAQERLKRKITVCRASRFRWS